MLNIFLSWSGERSKAIAEYLSLWMPRVIQSIHPWVSTIHIDKGQRWFGDVSRKLQNSHFGIICVTPENYKEPWLLFEAGALSKHVEYARICPLLYGMVPHELSGPLAHFQAATITKDDVYKLMMSINKKLGSNCIANDILCDSFERFWPDLAAKMQEISKIKIPGDRIKISRVVSAFSKYGLPEPSIGSEVSFSGGFESHSLYSSVMDIAKRRLWMFGRKNRKVFDKEHRDFFDNLNEKMQGGFDFRILFLDPESPDHVIKYAHKDNDFPDQLRDCILTAKKVLKSVGVDYRSCCKKYSIHRTMGMIIVDDAVIYSPIRIDSNGLPKKLTKAPFTVINAGSDFGKGLVNVFEEQWSSAAEL